MNIDDQVSNQVCSEQGAHRRVQRPSTSSQRQRMGRLRDLRHQGLEGLVDTFATSWYNAFIGESHEAHSV